MSNNGDREIEFAPDVSLQTIFRRYRGPIVLTYSLFILENLIRLAQPLVIGLAVSDLMRSSTRGVWLFLLQCLMQMLITTGRQLYDTRTFGTVSADLAREMVLRQRRAQIVTSRVAGRSALSREFAAFFERELPVIIATGFALLGSLLMLVWYDLFWGLLCAVLLGAYGLYSRVLGCRSAELNSDLHDLNEQEVDVVEHHEEGEVRRHFATIRHYQVKLSDWCGFSRGLTDLSLIAFLSIVLLHWETMATMSAGDLIAVIRYAVMFMTSLANVPLLVQAVLRLRDIGRRLRTVSGMRVATST